MVFIVLAGIFLLSAIAAMIFRNKLAIIASLICLVISFLIPVGIYSTNIGKVADLESFYLASSTNFELTRNDTASYLSEDKIESNVTLIPITGSIERMGIGQSVANRVLEYRNSVNAYNTAFAKYRAYKRNILFGLAYPTVPEEMRLLIINPVQNESPNNADTINVPNTNPAPDTNSPSVNTPTITPKTDSDGITKEDLNKALEDAINKVIEAK